MAINDYIRTSSLDIYDSVAYKNLKERDRYNRLLLGRATRAEVGQEAEANNLTARPPSWTQHAAGLSHAFVISALSSSQHEKQTLNARQSGTVALETSSVPASGTEYYSKRSRFVTVTVKVTGSSGMAGTTLFSAVSGARLDSGSNVLTPFTVPFNITTRGKVVDVRVWVELVSVSGSEGVLGNLSVLGLALKNPNVKFDSSMPIMNDPTLIKTGQMEAPFFRSSYLLWVGSQLDDAVLAPVTDILDHYTWGKDRHVRTVFSDSAHPLDGNNPRNLASSHGDFFSKIIGSSVAAGYVLNSPNGATLAGNDWPWFSDTRIQEGGSHGAVGSPPSGWLSGPGGTAAVNEWPTTGSNYGPAVIRPMYPLLDDVLEEKCLESVLREKGYAYPEENMRDTAIAARRGIRPGLRGKQAHGRWELLIVTQDVLSSVPVVGLNFRQARLELTIDTGEDVARQLPRKRGIEARRAPKPIAIVSGSYIGAGRPDVFGYATNKFRNVVYTLPQQETSTTVGITNDTGSMTANDFAVFTRITGALATTYDASSKAHARFMFLNNEFGTPFIPLSSGSGLPAASELFAEDLSMSSTAIFDILNPKALIESNATMAQAVSSTRLTGQTRDRVLQITSGSA